jgi:hypothetical protein
LRTCRLWLRSPAEGAGVLPRTVFVRPNLAWSGENRSEGLSARPGGTRLAARVRRVAHAVDISERRRSVSQDSRRLEERHERA